MPGVVVLSAVFLAVPDPQLAAHLAAWEKAAKDIANVRAEFTLTRTEPVFKRESRYTGTVLHLRPRFTRLRLESAADRADYESYVFDGKSLYRYDGRAKSVTEFRLADRPATTERGSAGWLARMYAALVGLANLDDHPALAPLVGVTRHHQVSVFKEDTHYVYLEARPGTPEAEQLFARVRMALHGPAATEPRRPYTPAQVYAEYPDGTTELWAFSDVRVNVPGVDPKAFRYEEVPGYEFRPAPAASAAPKP
jgi:TIGR03009 family protein